jgi:hypothetical protein
MSAMASFLASAKALATSVFPLPVEEADTLPMDVAVGCATSPVGEILMLPNLVPRFFEPKALFFQRMASMTVPAAADMPLRYKKRAERSDERVSEFTLLVRPPSSPPIVPFLEPGAQVIHLLRRVAQGLVDAI